MALKKKKKWLKTFLLTVCVRHSLSACQPSRKCSQRCILFSRTVQWTESSDIRSRAFRRSPTVSHIVGRWPSPLKYTKRKKTECFNLYLYDGWHFKSLYLGKIGFTAWSIRGHQCTWEVLTEDLDGSVSFRVSDLLVSLFQRVGLQQNSNTKTCEPNLMLDEHLSELLYLNPH